MFGRTSTSWSPLFLQVNNSLHRQFRGPLGNRDNAMKNFVRSIMIYWSFPDTAGKVFQIS